MRIIFSGGGTGGHIYPALSMARYVKKKVPQAAILFIGADGGMEENIIPEAGFDLETLAVKGFSRKKLIHAPATIFRLGSSCARARRIIEKFKPDVVMGTGGYASAPTLLAALLGRKKTIIHEQNIIPGMTNRFLSPWVDKVCVSFDASRDYYKNKSNVLVTGNPRSSDMKLLSKESARESLRMDNKLPLLLVFGGSRGAARINQCMVDYLEKLTEKGKMQVLYITGEIYYDEITSRLEKKQVFDRLGDRLKVKAYQREMPSAMAAADLMISRAGATTLAEITALGVPSILIPSPNVVNDHQRKNALSLVREEAAVMIEEDNLTAPALKDKIEDLLGSPVKLKMLSKNSRKLGKPDAAENIFKLIAL